MEKISDEKRRDIAIHFINGLPRTEIATLFDVSTGTVRNIANEVNNGQFSEFSGLENKLKLHRKIAEQVLEKGIPLERLFVTALLLDRFIQLGVEPEHFKDLVEFFEEFITDEYDIKEIVEVVIQVYQFMRSMNISINEIPAVVEQKAEELRNLDKQIPEKKSIIKQMGNQVQELNNEISSIDQQRADKQQQLEDAIAAEKTFQKYTPSEVITKIQAFNNLTKDGYDVDQIEPYANIKTTLDNENSDPDMTYELLLQRGRLISEKDRLKRDVQVLRWDIRSYIVTRDWMKSLDQVISGRFPVSCSNPKCGRKSPIDIPSLREMELFIDFNQSFVWTCKWCGKKSIVLHPEQLLKMLGWLLLHR